MTSDDNVTRIHPRFLNVPEGPDTRTVGDFLVRYALLKRDLESVRPVLESHTAERTVIGAMWTQLTLVLVNAVNAHNQFAANTQEDNDAFNALRALYATLLEVSGAASPEHIHREVFQIVRREWLASDHRVTKLVAECWPESPPTQ